MQWQQLFPVILCPTKCESSAQTIVTSALHSDSGDSCSLKLFQACEKRQGTDKYTAPLFWTLVNRHLSWMQLGSYCPLYLCDDFFVSTVHGTALHAECVWLKRKSMSSNFKAFLLNEETCLSICNSWYVTLLLHNKVLVKDARAFIHRRDPL